MLCTTGSRYSDWSEVSCCNDCIGWWCRIYRGSWRCWCVTSGNKSTGELSSVCCDQEMLTRGFRRLQTLSPPAVHPHLFSFTVIDRHNRSTRFLAKHLIDFCALHFYVIRSPLIINVSTQSLNTFQSVPLFIINHLSFFQPFLLIPYYASLISLLQQMSIWKMLWKFALSFLGVEPSSVLLRFAN